ncbi:MAG: hypothetical protein C0599_11025, partial [Salinivirgaceae bacterium]
MKLKTMCGWNLTHHGELHPTIKNQNYKRMKHFLTNFFLIAFSVVSVAQNPDSVMISKIFKNALDSKEAYLNLKEL